MNICKVTKLYDTNQRANRENQFSFNHYNIARQKIGKGLKVSKGKQKSNLQTALKLSASNIPLASIDLAQHSKKKMTVNSLQKCKSQLSLQKKILLKQLESKQEKLQILRQTVRSIQSSRPKLVLQRDGKQQKVAHVKRNTDMTSVASGPQNLSKQKLLQNLRLRASNSKQILTTMQRTRLFPTKSRQLE